MSRQLEPLDFGQVTWQKRSLDIGHDFKLSLDDLVGLLQFLAQYEGLGCSAKQATGPEPFGNLVRIEGPRLFLHDNNHVKSNALIVMGHGEQRAMSFKVLEPWIVGLQQRSHIVDKPRFSAMNQVAQQASLQHW